MNLIVDSSVILKWFYEEEGDDKALIIYTDVLNNKINLFLPSLTFFEVGNGIRFKKPFSSRKLEEAKKVLESIKIHIAEFSLDDWQQNAHLSYQYNLSFYDSTYIYLAKKLNTRFITADRKLYQKTKSLGFVKLL